MATPEGHSPHQNHLLDALPASAYERLVSHLELVSMKLGEVLYESGVQLRYVYFPTCRAPGTLSGSGRNCLRTSSGVSDRRCISCCATPRR